MEENKEELRMLFELITAWRNKETSGNKIVWVRCRVISLSMWNHEYFEKAATTMGD